MVYHFRESIGDEFIKIMIIAYIAWSQTSIQLIAKKEIEILLKIAFNIRLIVQHCELDIIGNM